MTRARGRYAALALALALLVTGCSDDGDGDGTDEGGSTTTSAAEGTGELTSFDDIASLHEALVDAGVECGLEYEGLEDDDNEVSICVIEGEQALLTIWGDPALVAEFAASDAGATGTVAFGQNWTVDVDSFAVASLVADALGGTVPDVASDESGGDAGG